MKSKKWNIIRRFKKVKMVELKMWNFDTEKWWSRRCEIERLTFNFFNFTFFYFWHPILLFWFHFSHFYLTLSLNFQQINFSISHFQLFSNTFALSPLNFFGNICFPFLISHFQQFRYHNFTFSIFNSILAFQVFKPEYYFTPLILVFIFFYLIIIYF